MVGGGFLRVVHATDDQSPGPRLRVLPGGQDVNRNTSRDTTSRTHMAHPTATVPRPVDIRDLAVIRSVVNQAAHLSHISRPTSEDQWCDAVHEQACSCLPGVDRVTIAMVVEQITGRQPAMLRTAVA